MHVRLPAFDPFLDLFPDCQRAHQSDRRHLARRARPAETNASALPHRSALSTPHRPVRQWSISRLTARASRAFSHESTVLIDCFRLRARRAALDIRRRRSEIGVRLASRRRDTSRRPRATAAVSSSANSLWSAGVANRTSDSIVSVASRLPARCAAARWSDSSEISRAAAATR